MEQWERFSFMILLCPAGPTCRKAGAYDKTCQQYRVDCDKKCQLSDCSNVLLHSVKAPSREQNDQDEVAVLTVHLTSCDAVLISDLSPGAGQSWHAAC